MTNISIKLIETEDGSSSLYREDLNETYHSFHGARGESMHVFIQFGLRHVMAHSKSNPINVFEVGMGTGLNVFLTAQVCKEERRKVRMTTLEPIPIGEELAKKLNYAQSDEDIDLLRMIHSSEWEREVTITNYFSLYKTQQRLEDFLIPRGTFDVIYFDAFAPSKQPEMWSIENLRKCYEILNTSGILVTYCAQGQFKRNLKEAGFEVESLPGAMGKKEMVRGLKSL
jgi:tRNA U34 5-methylaminomethyl-2-thiouridine-forming methyltransferase MnmC